MIVDHARVVAITARSGGFIITGLDRQLPPRYRRHSDRSLGGLTSYMPVVSSLQSHNLAFPQPRESSTMAAAMQARTTLKTALKQGSKGIGYWLT